MNVMKTLYPQPTSPPSQQSYVKLSIVPLPLPEANRFVEHLHRHNKPVPGAKFCLGVADIETGVARGIAIIGRPIARLLQDGVTLEVTRCCTDGCPNACSMLYSAARSAAFAQGYRRLVTYTLQSEAMSSLKAAGWEVVTEVEPPLGKGWISRPGRKDQLVSHLPKYRWETYARSERQSKMFPILLPWKLESNVFPPPKVLIAPETLVFSGKGNSLDIAATVELTARAVTEEEGGFSSWDVNFAVEIELLRASDCHVLVANPPTFVQVERVLGRMATRFPEQLINNGYGGFCWRAHRDSPPSPEWSDYSLGFLV